MSEVTVDLVRPLPAWLLRGVAALLGAATLLVAFAGSRPHPLLVAGLVALVVATVVDPRASAWPRSSSSSPRRGWSPAARPRSASSCSWSCWCT